VAQDYVTLRAQQARIALADENVAAQAETAQIATWRAQAGLTTELDVDRAESAVDETRAQLPALRSELEQTKNRLAILLGEPPGALDASLDDPAPIPSAPTEIAVGIPAQTLLQRPDVRRAERQLAAETARIGVTKAARYPAVSI